MKLISILALFFSVSAFADFTGQWSGQGVALWRGVTYSCANTWQLTHTADKFIINISDFLCKSSQGQVRGGWDLIEFTIANGELFYNQTKVGTITDKKISFQMDGMARVDFDLSKAGLVVNDYDLDINNDTTFILTAALTH